MSSPPSHQFVDATRAPIHKARIWFKAEETNNTWEDTLANLQGNVLSILSGDNTTHNSLIAIFPLNHKCRFQSNKDKDDKNSFSFDLHVGRHKKRFRVKSAYEREYWRACIEGVITGSVPDNAVISPQDAMNIANRLRLASQNNNPHPHTQLHPYPDSYPSVQSPPSVNFDPSHIQSSVSGYHLRRSSMPNPELQPQTAPHSSSSRVSGPRSTPSSDGASAGSLQECMPHRRHPSVVSWESGGSSSGSEFEPRQRHQRRQSSGSMDSGYGAPLLGRQQHKFSNDANATVPPWFFETCSRELAEKILAQCPDRGNTLMRVSSAPDADYAISSRKSGVTTHYAVVRLPDGHRIKVDNCTSTLQTLSDVMAFFRQVAGEATTHLMTTNSLVVLLGFDDNSGVYSRQLPVADNLPPTKSESDNDSGGSAIRHLEDAIMQEEEEMGSPNKAGAAQLPGATYPRMKAGPTNTVQPTTPRQPGSLINELQEKLRLGGQLKPVGSRQNPQRQTSKEDRSSPYVNEPDEDYYEVLDHYQNVP